MYCFYIHSITSVMCISCNANKIICNGHYGVSFLYMLLTPSFVLKPLLLLEFRFIDGNKYLSGLQHRVLMKTDLFPIFMKVSTNSLNNSQYRKKKYIKYNNKNICNNLDVLIFLLLHVLTFASLSSSLK